MKRLKRSVFAGLFAFAVLVVFGLFHGTSAQETAAGAADSPNYDRWGALAAGAEDTLIDDRASDLVLNSLRKELVRFREAFLTAQKTNETRIRTSTGQLQALGPAPEEGASEAPEIAARRAELDQQLADLRAPVLVAEEAFERADGLIGEIDTLIRDRQTQRAFGAWAKPGCACQCRRCIWADRRCDWGAEE